MAVRAMSDTLGSGTALPDFVLHVVLLRTDKQMGRIHTAGHVTAMADNC